MNYDGDSNSVKMRQLEEDMLLNGVLSLSAEDFAFLGPSENLEEFEVAYKRALTDERQAVTCFRLGVACLSCFVQDNFCGPPKSRTFLPAFLIDTDASSTIRKVHLALDSESAYQGCRNPILLLVAKWTFVNSDYASASMFATYNLWTLRTVRVWQHLFPRRQLKLANVYSSLFVGPEEFLRSLIEFTRKVKVLVLIELVEICCYYYRFEDARIALNTCMDMLDFSAQVTGVLGRRTRFQTFDCPQLVLKVQTNGQQEFGDIETEAQNEDIVPATVPLTDDTLLEQVCLSERNNSNERPLNAAEQCALLAGVTFARRSGPATSFLKEEYKLYLEKVIEQRSNWAAQTAALYHRCQMEKRESRMVDRALKQMTDSIDQFYDSSIGVKLRFNYVFASCLPPIWVRETCLADIYFSVGCSNEALEMFTRLKAWDFVIKCYKRMGKLAKAESVIRQLLSEEETAEMYCYLGEITDDALYFVKSWNLSNERYSRAQRSLGDLLLRQRKYEDALVAFEKALRLQPLDLKSWFSRGFCAMKKKSYPLAIKCYKHCVRIEPDYAEAWCNLATALMEMREYKKAHRVMQDALRCKYEDLNIWENFVAAAMAAGRFEDALTGINHILDYGGDFRNTELIRCFVHACLETTSGMSSVRVELKLLLARLTAKYPNDLRLWKAYALIYEYMPTGGDVTYWEKVLFIVERIVTVERLNERWHLTESTVEEVLRWSAKLVDARKHLVMRLPPRSTRIPKLILSAEMLVDEVLGQIEKTAGFDGLKQETKELYLALQRSIALLKAV
ncbi:Tetratricopeptide repeat protein 27 [Trichuris trichiura]|uniref:Tetratricopeptide repeat protein 27 n=1 Tax=Trichuris trichiura TaxID=36087 RepID=A0A077Z3G4_TRITR|nr:Tetratricopeptide repeat protein 27 [Trichuris trichiura]